MHVVGERLGHVRPGMHEVHVQLLHHLGVIEQHLRHEGAGLQVATPLQLEHITLGTDHRPASQARQEIALVTADLCGECPPGSLVTRLGSGYGFFGCHAISPA